MMKPYKHICSNCRYFYDDGDCGVCVNCDSPSDIRVVHKDFVCDGGGCGSDNFGFTPKEEDEK